MNMVRTAVAAALLAAAPGIASAALTIVTVFSDDFDAENGGAGVLNYGGFANWTVSNGTVDLIGNGFIDLLPGHGLYVDMDGSTGDAGRITSRTFDLVPGEYQIVLSIAGKVLGQLPLSPSLGIVVRLLGILLCVVVGQVLFTYLEKPIDRMLRGRAGKPAARLRAGRHAPRLPNWVRGFGRAASAAPVAKR